MIEGINYSTEGIMRSLENLKCHITLFNMTDEQREEIESKMARCKDCLKWKFNDDLSYGSCESCSGRVKKSKKTIKHTYPAKKDMSKRRFSIDKQEEIRFMTEQRNKYGSDYYETTYLSLRDYVMEGMTIRGALGKLHFDSVRFYRDIPEEYRKRLMEIKKQYTAFKRTHL